MLHDDDYPSTDYPLPTSARTRGSRRHRLIQMSVETYTPERTCVCSGLPIRICVTTVPLKYRSRENRAERCGAREIED